jgi:ABC-type lipoprotein export system ATPase subunit
MLVTHDPEIAAFADRIITLKDGRIARDVVVKRRPPSRPPAPDSR